MISEASQQGSCHLVGIEIISFLNLKRDSSENMFKDINFCSLLIFFLDSMHPYC